MTLGIYVIESNLWDLETSLPVLLMLSYRKCYVIMCECLTQERDLVLLYCYRIT